MPRKSAASLAIVRDFRRELPSPPDSFTATQAAIWAAVVATKPVDWFQADCMPVLAAYCRAVDMDTEIARAVDSFDRSSIVDSDGLRSWQHLVKMQREQQQHVATLATKLRLTPQSRYNAITAASKANKATGLRPWGAVIEQSPGLNSTAESRKGSQQGSQ